MNLKLEGRNQDIKKLKLASIDVAEGEMNVYDASINYQSILAPSGTGVIRPG